jgi:hypothetical protein
MDDTGEGGAKPKKVPGIFRVSVPLHTHRRNKSVHICNKAESGEKLHFGTNELI